MMSIKEFLNCSSLTACRKGIWIILDEYFMVFVQEAMFTGVQKVFVNLKIILELILAIFLGHSLELHLCIAA